MRLVWSLVVAGLAFVGVEQAIRPLEAVTVNQNVTQADDPYLWLEDVHGAVPLAWVKEQNAKALSVLTTSAQYKADFDALLAVLDATDRIPFATLSHQYAFNFWQDAANPKGIWRRTSIVDYTKPAPQWEVLIDVDALAGTEKENWVWKGADCGPSLKRCLVTLSRGGGDAVVVREFDLTSKTFVPNGFVLAEAKSDATYVDDDTVLFGTDFGKGTLTNSGYPRLVKLWKRGSAIADARQVLEGKVEDVAVGTWVSRSVSGNRPLVVRSPTFFETEYFAVDTDGATTKVPVPLSVDLKGITQGQFVFTLRKDWDFSPTQRLKSGSLLAFSFDAWKKTGVLPAPTVLYAPGPRASIDQVATGRDAVYASIYDNVIGSIHVFRPPAAPAGGAARWGTGRLELPPNGSTSIVASNDYGPEAQFRFDSYLVPTTLFADKGDGRPVAIKSLPARFDATGLVTEQFDARSKDGTRVPYFVVHRKDTRGPQPALLYGYGGFEVSLTPAYSAGVGKLWLTKGGTYVVANIRGGGEFGPQWHDAALQTNRQRAFDDFAAVAADVARRGFTTARQLGIMGGSNGGLLVSTVMTQHPELIGAVVCQVPLIDMIRYTGIGAGASWAAEYGDPADATMAAYIRTYSPYQNVRKGGSYPPVFFVTATSDDRVTPVHARKMAARMMEQGYDVLFYENTDGGHAAAANHKQQAEMAALSYAYLAMKLGLK
ncbi:MAG: prolyl oligopeptidase family serine peptidase [Vicinamibacterales bacterium]